jgi:hypothetical protein
MQELIFYTGPGCHLCQQAAALFDQLPLAVCQRINLTRVDISKDPQLKRRYGQQIPLIQCVQTKRQLGWPFSLDQLANWLVEH